MYPKSMCRKRPWLSSIRLPLCRSLAHCTGGAAGAGASAGSAQPTATAACPSAACPSTLNSFRQLVQQLQRHTHSAAQSGQRASGVMGHTLDLPPLCARTHQDISGHRVGSGGLQEVLAGGFEAARARHAKLVLEDLKQPAIKHLALGVEWGGWAV